jgi:hypothetical protein
METSSDLRLLVSSPLTPWQICEDYYAQSLTFASLARATQRVSPLIDWHTKIVHQWLPPRR